MSERRRAWTDLPPGWAVGTIGHLIGSDGLFVDGDWVESKDQDPDGDVRLVQLADVGDGQYLDKSARFLTIRKASELRCTFVEEDDVLIARMPDPLGRACIFSGDKKRCVTVVDVCIVRAGATKFDHRWLMWFVNAPRTRSRIAELQSGSTRKRISRKNLGTVSLPIPPKPEQTRIVDEIEKQFTRLDAGVAALKRVEANLKRYKAAVLKAAVEGKLTERWRAEHPDVEPASELLKRILAERRRRWENIELARTIAKGKQPTNERWKWRYKPPAEFDSGLCRFELPPTWTWITLGCVAADVKDGPHYSPKYADSGVPFISGGSIRPEGIDFSTAKYVSRKLYDELCLRCRVEKGDLLYTKGGTTGIAKINSEETEFAVWVHVAVLKIVESIIPFYLQHALNSPLCYAQSQRYTHGVGNQDLGLTRMIRIALPLPPLAEQQVIVEAIDLQISVAQEVAVIVEHNLYRGQRMRQSILKRAFEGKLVPQDPTDEPALDLLKRVREEKPKPVLRTRRTEIAVTQKSERRRSRTA